jgi:hypothetical protein
MPLLTEDSSWEKHGVKCAKCSSNNEIRIKAGTLYKSQRFNKKHEFICSDCKNTKKSK